MPPGFLGLTAPCVAFSFVFKWNHPKTRELYGLDDKKEDSDDANGS